MAKTTKTTAEDTGKSEKILPIRDPRGGNGVEMCAEIPGIVTEEEKYLNYGGLDEASEDLGDLVHQRAGKDHVATDSAFYAPPEEHLKQAMGRRTAPRHRPSKDLVADGEPPPGTPVPRPRFTTFKTDSPVPGQRNRSFYNWWNGELPLWAKKRTLVYVYREHPSLLDPPLGPDNKPTGFKYIDKIGGEEPLQDDMNLLERYGCGTYKLVMNETDSTKKGGRTLCTVHAMFVGGNDYKSNPPFDDRINDPANVDPNFPGNAGYLAYLSSKGIIPANAQEQQRKEKEEELMATVAAVKSEQTQVDRLTDKVIELSAGVNKNESFTEAAMRNVLDIQKQSATAAIETVQQTANDRVSSMQATMEQVLAKTNSGSGGNTELLTLVISMMKESRGGVDAELAELRALNARMQDRQITILAEQNAKLLDERRNGASQFGSMKEAIAAMKEMRDTVQEFEGDRGEGGKGIGEIAGGVAEAAGAPKWLQAITPILPHVMPFLTQLATMMGQRVTPGGVPTPPMPQTYNPQVVPPQPPPNGNVLPFPPQVQGPPPIIVPPAGTTLTMPPELATLLDHINVPLAQYLNDDATGEHFANFFISGWGEQAFEQIKSAGPDAILGALRMHPQTSVTLSYFPQQRVENFIKVFTSFDSTKDEENEEETVPAS